MAAEYLCPTTDLPCPIAQMTAEVLSENVLKLLSVASEKVAVLGYFANLEMQIDRDTITNIRAIEGHIYDRIVIMNAIQRARNDVVTGMMPAYLSCGRDESSAGDGCDINRGNEVEKRALAAGSLKQLASKIVENLNAEQGKDLGII